MLKKDSINIRLEDLPSWYASIGFNLPRTEEELARFNKLYSDFEFELTGHELSANKIWNDIPQIELPHLEPNIIHPELIQFRMAARGLKDIPDDIRRLMVSNQQKSNETSK